MVIIDNESEAANAAGAAWGRLLLAAGDPDDEDAVLRAAARELCVLSGIARCSVFVADAAGELLRGRVGHPAEIDAAVQGLVAGGPSDGVVAAVRQTGAAVAIPDTGLDRRADLGAVRRRGVRSLLAVPVPDGDALLAVCVLEHGRRRHPLDRPGRDAAAAFCLLLGGWLARSRAAREVVGLRAELEAQREVLARSVGAERTWQGLASGIEPSANAGAELAAILGRDVVRLGPDGAVQRTYAPDPDGRRPEPTTPTGHPGSPPPLAALLAGVAGVPSGAAVLVGPSLDAGLRDRWAVAPVRVDGAVVGGVATPQGSRRLQPAEIALVGRVAGLVGMRVALGRRRRADERELRRLRTAGRLGVRPVGPPGARPAVDPGATGPAVAGSGHGRPAAAAAGHVVAAVPGDPASVTALGGPEAVEAALGAVLGGAPVVAIAVAEGLVVVADLPPPLDHRAAPAAVARAVESLELGAVVAGVAAVRLPGEDLAPALAEARAVAAWGATHGDPVGSARAVTTLDLGPARLLLGTPGDAGRIAREVLGPLLEPRRTRADLLATTRAYFDAGRTIRGCASRLGIHENTVRHRLTRIADLTGHDPTASADQLALQTALLALEGPEASPATGAGGGSARTAQPVVESGSLRPTGPT